MGLLSKLIGEDENKPVNSTRSLKALTPEARAISFDARLVDQLKDEHQGLLQAYTAIRRTGAEGHFGHLPEMLEEFKLALLNHIALENVKFYVYMQNHWAVDKDTMGFIAGVRKEMNSISRTVVKFIDAHLANAPSHLTIANFNEELEKIGDVLIKRIRLEEERLYSLYRP